MSYILIYNISIMAVIIVLYINNIFCVPSKFAIRRIWQNVIEINESLRVLDDFDLMITILEKQSTILLKLAWSFKFSESFYCASMIFLTRF